MRYAFLVYVEFCDSEVHARKLLSLRKLFSKALESSSNYQVLWVLQLLRSWVTALDLAVLDYLRYIRIF